MSVSIKDVLKATAPIAKVYVSYFDSIDDALFVIARPREVERMDEDFDSFKAVYNRLVGAAITLDHLRLVAGEETRGVTTSMKDIVRALEC